MYCKQAAFALLLLAACKQQVTTAPPRTAVLRFENLSNAEWDWQGRALSELLKRRFSGDRMPRAVLAAPGISTERIASLSAGATRLITGYYTSTNGLLTVTAFAEDALTQKLTGPTQVSGPLPVVVAELAKHFGASAAEELNASSAALHEFSIASDTAGPAAIPHYELAIEADPNFGPAYLGLTQTDPAHARQTLSAASLHAASFTKQDRAYVELESATVARDNKARLGALTQVADMNGSDAGAIRALADAEMSARQPVEAAKHYRQAITLAPLDANLRNLLAYASIFSGDEAGARSAAADYKRLLPGDPNTLDTEGDVEMAFGHFAAAEKAYAATPVKAARARLMSGDVAGATALLEKQPKTAVTGYRAAEWLYLTGHQPEGTSAMAAFAASASQPELRSAAYTQAAIWALLAHDTVHATQWADLGLKPAQQSTFVTAALARFLAQPAADADTSFKGENAGPIRLRAKGLALLLAGRFEEAVPVWKQIYDSSDVNDVTPMYMYGFALLRAGHQAEAAPLLRLVPIPSAGIAPSFEALYLPALRQ